MTNLSLPPAREIIHFTYQPDFPSSDLNINNAAMLKHVLQSEAGLNTYASVLEKQQMYIFSLADAALKRCGVKSEHSQTALSAFSDGFATLETMVMLARPPQIYDTRQSAQNVSDRFVQAQSLVEAGLSNTYTQWPRSHPITYSTVNGTQ